jgi:hypothetical protein
MVISKQCTPGTALNSVSLSICRRCSAPLRPNKYIVRVKKKTPDGRIKWRSRSVNSVEKAIVLDKELLEQKIQDQVANQPLKPVSIQQESHRVYYSVS